MPNYAFQPSNGTTLTEQLLFSRGHKTKEAQDAFLSPDYDRGIHDPFLLKDMDVAVERIVRAIKNNERIVVYGDFDADGVPASVLMHDFFKKISYTNFSNYIPHRHLEGFGLHKDAISKVKEEGAQLLITLDCGITDVDEVDFANSLGIDVIITDHHLPGPELPQAVAVVDPKRADCSYPFDMLCGAGVAFKLVQGLLAYDRSHENVWNVKEGWEKWLLDMVGIATLSDMVPLHGENRVLAYFGLKVLRKSPRLGLVKLLKSLDIKQQHLVEDDIGFLITPRINAASRMANPMDAFNMLTAATDEEAERTVTFLNTLNVERKSAVAVMMKEIKKKVEGRDLTSKSVFVLGNPNWKPSLLGLVATSLVREYDRPVFLWGRSEDGTLKGSTRSDGRVDIVQLMRAVPREIFIDFGGHVMSGGFSLTDDHVHRFEDELCTAHDSLSKQEINSSVLIDARITSNDVTWDLFSTIEKLAPFGEANPKPLFMVENVVLTNAKTFGKTGDHFEVTFTGAKAKKLSAIKFFIEDNEIYKNLKPGDKVHLVANLEKSMFRNFPELRLRIVDILPA
ncbi:MAG: single-stranded-DNA-specific exonuclease, single-stranded-DNA-specific exonuclease [Candidatus Parcubacteria bacterium]|jgi:single-stranded-DNA-specific exonuclease